MIKLTPYKQLVEKLGEAGAKQEMSRRSKLNTSPNRGFAVMDEAAHKSAASKGGQTTAERYFKKDGKNRQSRPIIQPVDSE